MGTKEHLDKKAVPTFPWAQLLDLSELLACWRWKLMVGKATLRDAVEVRSLHLFLAEHRLASTQTRSTGFSAARHSSSPQSQIRNSAVNPALHNLCANCENTGGRKTCSHSSHVAPHLLPPSPAAFAPHHLRFQVFKAVTYQSSFRSDK